MSKEITFYAVVERGRIVERSFVSGIGRFTQPEIYSSLEDATAYANPGQEVREITVTVAEAA